MRASLGRLTTLLIAGLIASGCGVRAQEPQRLWLDEPGIASWNTPGGAIPSAPREDPLNPECRSQARPPQTEEDRQVRERGWDLVGAFQGGWDIVVVYGAADYDGMCRPWQFQHFVFVRGRFAGTLAPEPMDSRTDGALSQVYLQGPAQLIASYVRYQPSDPLCCPSGRTEVTFEIEGDPPVVRPRTASTWSTATATP